MAAVPKMEINVEVEVGKTADMVAAELVGRMLEIIDAEVALYRREYRENGSDTAAARVASVKILRDKVYDTLDGVDIV